MEKSAKDVYEFHGLVLNKTRTSQLKAECPFCMKNKFYVDPKTGKFDCKVCQSRGNALTFIRQLWEESLEGTIAKDYREVVHGGRGNFIPQFEKWGLAKSLLTGDWVAPCGKDVDKIQNLCCKANDLDNWTMYGTPTFAQGLFGLPNWTKSYKQVFICEGIWDGCAVQAAVDQLKWKANVVAVPGCQTWNTVWNYLFKGKEVTFLYDNDHDRVHESGKVIYSPGMLGQQKAAKAVSRVAERVNVTSWGDGFSYNEELPDKTDMRDVLLQKVRV